MSLSLMTTRRFTPLFWCQFFAAFGDNFLKTALVFVILFEVSGANSAVLITLAGATLIAPFFFLSGLGGELADRYDKAFVAQRIKLTEIGAAIVGVAGFAFHSLSLLFLAVFMFGTLASLFGPIKYGILPDLLKRRELPSGNALIEAGTFLAILLGTIVAGIAANGNSSPIHFAWLMILTAVASWCSSLFIPHTPEAAPDLRINGNILASTRSLIRLVRADPRLWWGAVVASWFWLVGALVLSLLPPLVSFNIGGSEQVVTLFLTIFSVSVGIGSGLAAWLAAGRIVLLPTLVATVLLGLFALDLGWTASALVPATSPLTIAGYFAAPHSIHLAVDLAGLAIAGGLFIVPVFTAIQVWAGNDRRARVVAAVNVLNAAFMVVGALVLALLQKLGLSTPLLFALIGAANLAVAVAIGLTMPASWLNDFLSIVFRAFFRLEVKGLENIDKAGPNAIIALNHVSFLDPPLAVSILPKRPVFAIDVTMSKHWWIQPFLKFVRTMALDPLKPFSLRALINAVRDGNMLVIFPEGRITVTGSLMKVYDGAAMIADKADAMVVPVRIDGPEVTIFSRLKSSQVRRRLFPKITVTILEPVKLKIDPELKGRKRRQAAGAALYEVMSQLIYRTTSTDRTVVEALIEQAHRSGPNWLAVEDPVSGRLSYKRLLIAASILGRKLMPLAPEGRALGVMLPTSNGARGHVVRGHVGGPRAGDDQFHRRCGQYPVRLPRRGSRHHSDLARFRRKGPARQRRRPARRAAAPDLPGRYPPDRRSIRQAARPVELEEAAGRPQAGRLGGDHVHVGIGGTTEGRRAVTSQHVDQCGAGCGADRFRPRGQAVQRAAGVSFLRPDRRHGAAAGLRRLDLSVPVAAALPHRAGADLRQLRHRAVRHRHIPQRLCAGGQSVRFSLAALRAGRRRAGRRNRPGRFIWKSSACAFSKAMA